MNSLAYLRRKGREAVRVLVNLENRLVTGDLRGAGPVAQRERLLDAVTSALDIVQTYIANGDGAVPAEGAHAHALFVAFRRIDEGVPWYGIRNIWEAGWVQPGRVIHAKLLEEHGVDPDSDDADVFEDLGL